MKFFFITLQMLINTHGLMAQGYHNIVAHGHPHDQHCPSPSPKPVKGIDELKISRWIPLLTFVVMTWPAYHDRDMSCNPKS